MSSITGQPTNSGNLVSVGLRFELANLFASLIVHPFNWYFPRLGYNKFSWAFTFGPFTLTQVDYGKYTRLMQEQAKESAKELQSILEKIEKVNDTAKDKFKELTRTDYDSSKVGPDKAE